MNGMGMTWKEGRVVIGKWIPDGMEWMEWNEWNEDKWMEGNNGN